jgi:hypothetical protein
MRKLIQKFHDRNPHVGKEIPTFKGIYSHRVKKGDPKNSKRYEYLVGWKGQEERTWESCKPPLCFSSPSNLLFRRLSQSVCLQVADQVPRVEQPTFASRFLYFHGC